MTWRLATSTATEFWSLSRASTVAAASGGSTRGGLLQWQQPDGNVWHVEIVDTKGDGNLQIVHSNAGGQITIRDQDGKVLRQSKPGNYFSSFSVCRWPTAKDSAAFT